MAKHDYIPERDAEFLSWSQTFMSNLLGNLEYLGLEAADVNSVDALFVSFQSFYYAHTSAQNAATAAREIKNSSRQEAERAIRSLVRQLQVNPNVTDNMRAMLGITVPDRNPSINTTGVDTRPLGKVDTSQRLRHAISFTDEATPTSRAKPDGVMGCEVWVKVLPTGEAAPSDPSELTFLALDTASPYVAEYPGAEAGKTAHYLLRWVKTNGEKGPWSETVSATIVG